MKNPKENILAVIFSVVVAGMVSGILFLWDKFYVYTEPDVFLQERVADSASENFRSENAPTKNTYFSDLPDLMIIGEEISSSSEERTRLSGRAENSTEEKLSDNVAAGTKLTASTDGQNDYFYVNLDVPFVVQAPLGNWKDRRQQSACEEAAVLMAMKWVRGETAGDAVLKEKEILAIADFEEKNYGDFRDTSAKDTIERIFKGYFGYNKVFLKENIGTEEIKQELKLGNVVIVPLSGQILNNPHFNPARSNRAYDRCKRA